MSDPLLYEYTVRGGDTLSGIIGKAYNIYPRDSLYSEVQDQVMSLNPQISNPNRIFSDSILRLGMFPPPRSPQQCFAYPELHNVSAPDTFITASLTRQQRQRFWALSWLQHHSSWLTAPGSVGFGMATNLLSPGNVGLLEDVMEGYAHYKTGKLSKGQYDYLRRRNLQQFSRNVGPFERVLFGKKTTQQSIRIARAGGIPATAQIKKHADRLRRLSKVAGIGGIALTGVGMTAACMQIANTLDQSEKNEIFVETVLSSMFGLVGGYAATVFLVSNPVGWGTALVLAVGSTAVSYAAGKGARAAYGKYLNRIDFVTGTGVSSICR